MVFSEALYPLFRDGILGHNFNKRIKSFAPYMLFRVPSIAWRILKKPRFFAGFQSLYKKIRETRKLESIHEYHFVETEK
jgi:hypothetical protein